MELFVGVTLDEFLKENGGRIDGESAVAIALSVGGALKIFIKPDIFIGM